MREGLSQMRLGLKSRAMAQGGSCEIESYFILRFGQWNWLFNDNKFVIRKL